MIKFLIYALTMMIISVTINYLDQRGTKSVSGDNTNYVVRIPAMLKYVYFALFAMGMLLFFVFLFFKIKGNESITTGNFVTALVICTIGLLVMTFAAKWHIVVKGDKITIYRLFGKAQTIRFADIDRAVEGSKGQIKIYKEGKRVITVDLLCDNYDLLCNSLILENVQKGREQKTRDGNRKCLQQKERCKNEDTFDHNKR